MPGSRPSADCRTLSCSDFAGLADDHFDRVVSNYVPMDGSYLDGAVSECFRVLQVNPVTPDRPVTS